MKRQNRILAGSAIALLMASAPLSALPLGRTAHLQPEPSGNLPLLRVQAECQDGESAEDCAARKQQEEQPAEQAPAKQPAPEPAPGPEAASPPEPAPPPPAEEAPAEQPAPAPEPPPAPEPEAAPKPAPAPAGQAPAEQAPAEQPASDAAPAPEPAPAPEATPAPAPEAAPTEKAPAEKPAPAPDAAPAQDAAPEQKPAPTEGTAPAPDQPAQGEAAPVDENAPPILDSQKEKPARRHGGKNGEAGQQTGQDAGGEAAAPPLPAVDQAPPPADDKAAQQAIQPETIVPITREEGKRVERAPQADVARRHRPEGADVVKKFGDRVIIQFGDQTLVESSERPRMTRGASDVYYEDLPRGRTRETIVRSNGDQVVTIRNRDGDVLQRSRITPDGREHILTYVDERHYEDIRDWRDPGEDLPPMRLTIPRKQYILDSESVEDPDEYYEFLEQPPVERVQRLYSIDEVKRSARVRDIARRVDLDTLNFDFGSAEIGQSEVDKLQGVAEAMERLLKKNPAETFLIEGHTDAVGSDNANLALSDRRAEAVADALTNYFDIPPENLTTQGYGERYLKVNTESAERENRRVAIRRITPLVAPVASSK